MNTVSLHVDSVVNALGWTLLHFLWQGAAIAAAYAILSAAFKGCRANVRYNLGVLALFFILLTPVLTFLSIFQLPVVQTGLGEPLLSFSVQTAGAQSTSWLGGLGLWFDLLTPWAVAGWLAGVALMSRKLFKEWSQVKQLVRHNVKPLPANWQRVADSLHRLFGIRVVVRVLESGKASVPMVLGWLKPVILVPSSAILGLSQQQLEMLLAHEFAHIRRMDYLVNLLQIFVETLLFYHPAIRWLSARVRHERELCCDELVVELKGDSLVYARALAGMEELRSLRPSPSIGMAASGGHLLTRISRLSAAPVPQKGVLHWIVGLAVMGQNLALNIARNGFPISVFNRTIDKVDAFMDEMVGTEPIHGAHSIDELVDRMLYTELMTRVPDHGLMVVDRMSMATGTRGPSTPAFSTATCLPYTRQSKPATAKSWSLA